MSTDFGEDAWETIDPWWETFMGTRPWILQNNTSRILDRRWKNGPWVELDPWWETYAEVRRSDVAELTDLVEDLDRAWEESHSRFDTDPLGVDWTEHRDIRGPLRPGQEENWSQWLAHLIRESPREFRSALFGECFSASPDSVRREVHLPDVDEPDRYADILVFVGDRGVSIEVKIDDLHYEKTTHTAALIERQHNYDWQHVILLPKYNESFLRQAFKSDFEVYDGGRPQIRSERSDPISVVYWQDVSTVIRNVLRRDVATDPHWEASSYLLCTLIEQQILGFRPSPVVERIATAEDVVHASQSLPVATGGVDEQIRYLRDTMGSKHE